ncbi:hypothetical protein [Emticicia sp. C21]|uniref:hypothetical protein n=1 Tax=Emticicia sp. C21 TaxID=2302915 RepID=UPI000E34ED4C|nr:hypothetical protein [Emticicia sp. C21]RFS18043.1 hypothetical protein D0T08_02005 [Emticicia sp. C21]
MPLKLKLIYILCCLIDAIAFAFHQDWVVFLGALPPICLLNFYTLRRKGEYKLKDYTYTIGLVLAIVADIIIEFNSVTANVLALVFYMLSYSFYIATVRKETVFTASSREVLKVVVNMLLIISPILLAFSAIPSDYFFASMLYMVFLALLYTSALLRKTNKSSYQWFLSGALGFAVLTVCKVYFTFIFKIPYGSVIIKIIYDFAQYATFMGVIKTFKNFYPASEK